MTDRITYISESGSRYSINENGVLVKNNELLKLDHDLIKYSGIITQADVGFEGYERIWDFKSPEFKYIKQFLPAYLFGLTDKAVESFKHEFNIEANSIEETITKLRSINSSMNLPFNLRTLVVDYEPKEEQKSKTKFYILKKIFGWKK